MERQIVLAACVAAGLLLAVFIPVRQALWIAVFLEGMAMSACWVSDYGLPIAFLEEHEAIPFYSVQVVVAEGTKVAVALAAGFAIKEVGFAPVALPAAGVAAVCCVLMVRLLKHIPGENGAAGRA